jgi:hypothetical protein
MPKRVIDSDAMWGSDKLAACAAWAQAEYAWLYGLADASGCFELTNLRVIWGRVAAVRGNLTIERLEQVFAEFQDKGLLFVWEYEGKRYAHWTGSDVPGRLPPPSWRMRLEKFAPPVPKQRLAEYMARFARGRAALAGGGFRGEAQGECFDPKKDLRFERSDLKENREPGGHATGSQLTDPRLLVTDREDDRGYRASNLKEDREGGERFGNSRHGERHAPAASSLRGLMGNEPRDIGRGDGLKERLEGPQAQDLGLDLDGNWGMGRDERQRGPSNTQIGSGDTNREMDLATTDSCNSNSQSNAKAHAMSPKELAVARELRVGQGPVCGPARVRPEVLERERRREAARAGSRSA